MVWDCAKHGARHRSAPAAFFAPRRPRMRRSATAPRSLLSLPARRFFGGWLVAAPCSLHKAAGQVLAPAHLPQPECLCACPAWPIGQGAGPAAGPPRRGPALLLALAARWRLDTLWRCP
ncbi:unnamed protein product [Amoebophrya sp. A120]|nr:unnamed protein product [Amoebophrya sp. A120]|eukprot:GSA120T00009364001.1